MNLKLENCDYDLKHNFDNYISLEYFRIFFLKLKKGEEIKISSKQIFSKSNLEKFLNAAIKTEGTIVTNNIIVAKTISDIKNPNKEIKRVLIIDNHNFFHRLFHAIPKMVNSKEIEVSLLKALSNFIKWFHFNSQDFSHIIFTSEGKDLYRKSYTEDSENKYKGNRNKIDESLKDQIILCEKFLEDNGFLILKKDHYEADDILASLTTEFYNLNIPVTAFTSDKDAMQLGIYPTFEIMDPKSKERNFAKDKVVLKYGIEPSQFPDYQGIVGDTADNVPGIKGFGHETAVTILKTYGTIENMLNNLDKFGLEDFSKNDKIPKAKLNSAKKKQEKILSSKNDLLNSRDLCKLRDYLFQDSDKNLILLKSEKPSDLEIEVLKLSLSKFEVTF